MSQTKLDSFFGNFLYILQEIEETQRTDGMRKAEGYLHFYKYNFKKNCYHLHIHKFHFHEKEDIARGESPITAKVKPLYHKPSW